MRYGVWVACIVLEFLACCPASSEERFLVGIDAAFADSCPQALQSQAFAPTLDRIRREFGSLLPAIQLGPRDRIYIQLVSRPGSTPGYYFQFRHPRWGVVFEHEGFVITPADGRERGHFHLYTREISFLQLLAGRDAKTWAHQAANQALLSTVQAQTQMDVVVNPTQETGTFKLTVKYQIQNGTPMTRKGEIVFRFDTRLQDLVPEVQLQPECAEL